MKYTKKQIEKSIAYWQNIVESINDEQKSLVNALYDIFGNDLYSNKPLSYKQSDIDNVFDVLNKYVFNNALPNIKVLLLTSHEIQHIFDKHNSADNSNHYYVLYLPIPNWKSMVNNNMKPDLITEYLVLNISNTNMSIAFIISALCHEMIHYYDTRYGNVLCELYNFYTLHKQFNEHLTPIFKDKMNLANSIGLTIFPDGNDVSINDLNNLSIYRLNKSLNEDDVYYEQMMQHLMQNKTNLIDHAIDNDGNLGAIVF